MDETTKAVIDRITVRFSTPRAIPGGHTSSLFYDTAQLTPTELARLAANATGHLPGDFFDVAVGMAYHGVFFAAAVAGGKQAAILTTDNKISGPSLKDKEVLVVTDVVLSGSELKRATAKLESEGAKIVGYACIIDRTDESAHTFHAPLFAAYKAPKDG